MRLQPLGAVDVTVADVVDLIGRACAHSAVDPIATPVLVSGEDERMHVYLPAERRSARRLLPAHPPLMRRRPGLDRRR